MTREMQRDWGVKYARREAYAGFAKGQNTGKFKWDTWRAAFELQLRASVGRMQWTPAHAGAYNVYWTKEKDHIHFKIVNSLTTHSFFLHFGPVRPMGSGPMGKVNETYKWIEPVRRQKCR